MAAIIRRASEADSEALSSLNTDVQSIHAAALPWRFKQPGPDTFPPDVIRPLLADPNNLIFIAEVNSAPAGYAYAQIVRQAETSLRHALEEVHLHHISVRPSCRRLGVGHALFDAVRAAGRGLGIELLTLQVWTFNEDARAFFRREGFVPYMERLWTP